MKTLRAGAISLLLIFMILPVNFQGQSMHKAGMIYCKSAADCRHEIGHLMDFQNGKPSRSVEFGTALQTYLYVQIKYADLDPFTNMIFVPIQYHEEYFSPFSGTSPQEELYAGMYAYVDGDVSLLPEPFQRFYDQDPKYTDLYNCLMRAEVRLCGLALHVETR